MVSGWSLASKKTIWHSFRFVDAIPFTGVVRLARRIEGRGRLLGGTHICGGENVMQFRFTQKLKGQLGVKFEYIMKGFGAILSHDWGQVLHRNLVTGQYQVFVFNRSLQQALCAPIRSEQKSCTFCILVLKTLVFILTRIVSTIIPFSCTFYR